MKQPIPDEVLDDRLFWGGTSGSGKSYNAMGRVERLLKRRARAVIVDPLGVWWGLRLLADGVTPSGLDVVIFGGKHGDLPLTEHAGALLAETVVGMKESCILDLSQLGTKAAERRFMLDFLTVLYRQLDGTPLHVIFDEADIFAPQSLVGDKDGPAPRLLGMMETVVRRGRVKGFIPWLISQRPAVLNKNVLSQADGIVAFKLTASQDRDAIAAWVEGQADKATWRAMYGELATAQTGEGLVWVPARGILERVQFPAKTTFDSTRTPKRGEKAVHRDLQPLDVGALRERLAKVEVEAKANDPKELRAEIARLKRELATKAPAAPLLPDRKVLEAEYERGAADGFAQAVDSIQGRNNDACSRLTHLVGELDALKRAIEIPITTPKKFQRAVPRSPLPPEPAHVTEMLAKAPSPRRPVVGNGRDAALPKGEKACLVVIAQRSDGVTREHVTVASGYKKSSRDAYISRLREKGYVQVDGDRVFATGAGITALGSDYEPMPTGDELRRWHLDRLPGGEKRVLEVLIEEYPSFVARDWIDQRTDYKKSSRDAYIARLAARQLILVERGQVRASPLLFS